MQSRKFAAVGVNRFSMLTLCSTGGPVCTVVREHREERQQRGQRLLVGLSAPVADFAIAGRALGSRRDQ